MKIKWKFKWKFKKEKILFIEKKNCFNCLKPFCYLGWRKKKGSIMIIDPSSNKNVIGNGKLMSAW